MTPRIAVVIPLYNHAKTIRSVVERVLCFCADVWVIDDGSTDNGGQCVTDLPVHYIRFAQNKGKGEALRAGASALQEAGFTHMISLDADAQHYPEDIPAFTQAIQQHPHAFIVGTRDFTVPNVPASSRFGRAFSGFWMFVQTGYSINDMQSGYRAYPLQALQYLRAREDRYSFEIEALVYAAWAGFAIKEIPIRVHYQPGEQRISHFRPLVDNLRITRLNTRLTIRALVPFPFAHHALDAEGNLSLLSPLESLRRLLKQSNPTQLGLAAGVSLTLCTLPLLGLQSIILLYIINKFHLNRLCALLVIPLSWPPLLPGVCVLLGYRLRHGTWLAEFSVQTLGYEAGQRFIEWILGSVVCAPAVGTCIALVVWGIARAIYAQEKKHEVVR